MKRLAILTVFVAVALVPLGADIAVTVGSRQAGLVVKDTRFEPGLQLASELRLGMGPTFRIPKGGELQLDAGASVAKIGASANAGGVIYRALAARSVWVGGAWVGESDFGLAVTVHGSLASYELSTLIALHGEVEVSPLWVTEIADGLSIRWSIPLSYQMRRDLAYGVGLGLRGDLRLEISAQ